MCRWMCFRSLRWHWCQARMATRYLLQSQRRRQSGCRRKGFLACEISEFHGDRITDLFERYSPSIGRDLTGRERYVFGSLRFK